MRALTPVLFHDPDGSKALVFLPDGLTTPHEEQQRVIGALTNEAIRGLAPGTPSAHLLQPTVFLTDESFHEAVLVASGVPRESIEAMRHMSELVERLVGVDDDAALVEALRQSPHGADPMLIQLCAELAERAAAAGDRRRADALHALANRLSEHIEPPALDVEAVIEALESARSEGRLEELVQRIRPALDYPFFTALTERIESDGADGAGRAAVDLRALRTALLTSVDAVDLFERQWAESAVRWIERLVTTGPDVREPLIRLMAISGVIDQMFFSMIGGLRESEDGASTERAAALESVESLARSTWESARARAPRADTPPSTPDDGTPS